MNNSIALIGLAAGIIQVAGYVLYYVLVIRREGKAAEPLTWLMFAYGTALLTVMELDSMWKEARESAAWVEVLAVLLLPIICSLGGIMVSVAIWRENYRQTKEWWPSRWKLDWQSTDGKAFAADLGLTVLYTILWMCTIIGITSGSGHLWWVIAFLIVSNVTTFPNFVPILREAFRHPEKEDARPWFVWTAAYALLLIPTWDYGSSGVIWPQTWWLSEWDVSFWLLVALMSYPAINTLMHGIMAVAESKKVGLSQRHSQ